MKSYKYFTNDRSSIFLLMDRVTKEIESYLERIKDADQRKSYPTVTD